MKRVLMVALMAMIMMCSGCKKAGSDKAVIMVNDMPITQAELQKSIDKQLNSPFLAQFDKKSDEYKLLELMAKDKAVNELIVKKIIDNEIIKRGITISENDLKEYKDKMIAQVGGDANFKEALAKNNITENEFNEMVANEIQVGRLINALSPVIVSDGDIKKFYNDNKASKFTHPDMVRASHILLKDEAKAKEVLAKAKAEKADFAALAKQYSEDPGSAQKGGDLGFFSKEDMVKPFSDAAFKLKPDTVSDLVKSEFGYHIIKVTDRKKASITPFDEVKAEIKKYLEDEKKVEVLQKFIDGQKSLVKIEYKDSSFDPKNIRNEVKKYSKQAETAPAPTAIQAGADESWETF
ncbi:MAG: peptidylprolyl isomerase [Candidatus Gastranaerophilales bacterium]|nr:peptidylprolyl isomerase [Candidatus Gastranaerophilales bacterium]